MWIRSRVVIPVSQPPIDDGALRVEGNRIAAVGRWKDLRTDATAQPVDLGDSLLLPGLINAHCHLDYTDFAGHIPPPKSFPDWIKALLALKATWSYSDYAQSWLHGASMLLRTGVTTVGDIEAVPELLPEVWTATPLRVLSFLEMTGIKSGRLPAEILADAVQRIETLSLTRARAALSPHAPYSTSPELLRQCGEVVRKRRWLAAIHIGESQAEFDMFMHRHGPLFDWLKKQRNMSDCGSHSPIQHVHRCGLLNERLLAIHANYLAHGDAELLAQSGATVVHCPRSHAYFGHRRFPIQELLKAGVNICLGTDSLASVIRRPRQKLELSLFHEMKAFAKSSPDVPPQSILQMVTRNPARSLGMEGRIGELSVGAQADLIAIPLNPSAKDPYDLAHSGPAHSVMIDGAWIFSRNEKI